MWRGVGNLFIHLPVVSCRVEPVHEVMLTASFKTKSVDSVDSEACTTANTVNNERQRLCLLCSPLVFFFNIE